MSLTVLRLGLAEMLYGDEKKPGVVINEAVELTKKYGADEDYQSSTACWVRWHASRVWTQSLNSCEQLYAGHRHQQLMQPLWPSLIQPERLFAQKSVSFR